MKARREASEQTLLLDWLNSLEVDSCMLATGPEDLQKGEVLLDLARHVTGKSLSADVRRRSIGTPALKSDCIYNLGLLMKDFATVLPPHLRIKPADLLHDLPALFQIVKFFKSVREGGSGSPTKERKWLDAALLSPTTPQKVPTLNLKVLDQQQSKPISTPKKTVFEPFKPQFHVKTPSRSSLKQSPKQGSEDMQPLRKVSDIEKSKIYEWLQSLDLFPKSYILADVEALTRSGVLLCDLLNRLEGKNAVIKGIERYPKNNTAALANVTKAMGVLRGFDKMPSRYLWHTAAIMQGEEEGIWGLLADIRGYYRSKARALQIGKSSRTREPSEAPLSSRIGTVPPSPKSIRSLSQRRSVQKEGDMSLSQSLTRESLSTLPQPSPRQLESEVRAWLTELKLSHHLGHDHRHFLEDPFKNGVLLCELVSKLEGLETIKVNKHPKSIMEARENVEKALGVLRERRVELPGALLRLGEKIVQGNAKAIWTLLWTLHRLYIKTVPSPFPIDLPYSQSSFKRLDQSLGAWIHSLGVSHSPVCPQGVMELMSGIRSGVLLCELVEKVLKVPVRGVLTAPKTETACLSNIRKALEPLRVAPQMCQEYVWRDKEIQYGDLVSVYGLLEDMHRLHDCQVPRRPGTRASTPYLGAPLPLAHFPPETQSRHKPSLSAASMSDLGVSHTPSLHRFRVNRHDPHLSQQEKTLPRESGFTPPPPDPSEPPHIFLTFDSTIVRDQEDGEWLEGWLEQMGVQFALPFRVHDLRNGVILCKTLEKLTGTRVPGFTEYPKTTAAALNNVRKALELLRKRPGFPKELLFIEEEVLRGNERVILSLFGGIRSSYKLKERSSLLSTRRASEKSFRPSVSSYTPGGRSG